MKHRRLIRAPVAVAAAVVAALLPPDPTAWTALRPDADLDAIAAAVARTALWAVAVWVLVALLAGGLARLPGALGAAGRRLVGWCVPRALRGLVLGGVAGSVLLGPAVVATATPVWPTTPAATSVTTPGPAWPTSPAAPSSPAVPSNPAPPPSAAPSTAPAPPPATPAPPTDGPPTTTPAAPGAASVVVRPGDSLWSITARALTRDGRPPTDARVAATWPTWYAANRAAIGSDPGLLHPGTTLHPPATDGSTP